MLTERMVFRAKYGHGDELVGLFKEFYTKMAAQTGMSGARIYTDSTGPMFQVVLESDFADLGAYAKSEANNPQLFADPEFQRWFGRMQELTEGGEKQLLNMEQM